MDIHGRNAVLEYLRALGKGSGARLFISQHAHGKIINTICSEARRAGVEIERVEKNFFEKLAPSSVHQGIILRIPQGLDAQPDDVVIQNAARSKGVLVFLDRLTDPHNVGSIIRTAEALGAHGVVVQGAHSAPINPTVIKASAGATAHVPVLEISNAGSFIEKARGAGFWIIGSAAQAEYAPDDLRGFLPAVLVIGSEGDGVRKSILEKCDRVVRIPLKGKVASLNASVAAGILLYHLLKQ